MGIGVTRKSPISGKETTLVLDITKEQINDYVNGTLVQDAFPNLTDDEREFILTGILPDEWDKLFGEGS
jgi:hypothetical protein